MSAEADELDNWRFERLYNNLFSLLVEHGPHPDTWRYDPLDSKYPTIDGILRRERNESGFKHLPEFALVQLKGTRLVDGEDAWPKLKNQFSRRSGGKPNPIEQVNAMAESCSALLIGLSVDVSEKRIEAAFIGAPEHYPADRQSDQPIEPDELLGEIVKVLDALRPSGERALPLTLVESERHRVVVTPVIFPRQKEIVYFQRQLNGTVSVGEKGVISASNIKINWTIPRGAKIVSVRYISGIAKIFMVPVGHPGPPYDTYGGFEEEIFEGDWTVKDTIPGVEESNLWWVLQLHFEAPEAVVQVKAV